MELIGGVQVKKLRLIPDERGFLMEMLPLPGFNRRVQMEFCIWGPGQA